MSSNILFKGLTRPAMIKGIPTTPLLMSGIFWFMTGVWTNQLYLILLVIPTWIIFRYMAVYDEYIFRLLFLKLKTMGNPRAKMFFKGVTVIQPIEYRKTNFKKEKRELLMSGLNLSDLSAFSKYIPFSTHVTPEIVRTREGDLIATWVCDGVAFETLDDEDLELYSSQLNTLIRSFAQYSVSFYYHNVREVEKSELHSHFSNQYLADIDRLYFESINQNKLRRNKLYLTLVYRPLSGRIDKASFKGLSLAGRKKAILEHIEMMKEHCGRLNNALEKKFNGAILSCYEEDGITYSQQLSFYNYLFTGSWQKVRVSNAPFYQLLGNVSIFFGKNTVEIEDNVGRKRFARCLEIKDYVNETVEGIFNALMYCNGDYVITQSFSQMTKTDALEALKRQSQQLRGSEDDAIRQIEDIEFAKDELISGNISFGKSHFSIMVYADSIEEVTRTANDITTYLTELGFIISLSSLSLAANYYAQLPCNFAYRPREPMISSQNYASMVSLHNFSSGKQGGNCWGDALTMLKTPSNQSYFLNLHQGRINRNDFGEKFLGHTIILGQSGTGKSVLAAFIFNQQRKYDHPSTFNPNAPKKQLISIYLDKDRGAEGNIRAMGGCYNTLKRGHSTGWNPAMLENTPESLSFLGSLVRMLVTRSGEKLTALEEEKIDYAVASVMALPKNYRQFFITRLLENITDGVTQQEKDNSIVKRLQRWKHGNALGWIFDNQDDSLNFDINGVFGFDGTQFLDDKEACAPITYYLLYRISELMDGRRGTLFIDEMWKWIMDEMVATFLNDKLVTARKNDWVIVMATQSPDQVIRSSIGRAIIQQCEGQILLPNPKAEEEDYVEKLKVSYKQFRLIKTLDPDSRQFLVRRSNECALVRLDLSGVGKLLKVMSVSKENVDVLEKVIEEAGENPDDWMPLYLSRCV
jgi:type IV secretion system protein VirB4